MTCLAGLGSAVPAHAQCGAEVSCTPGLPQSRSTEVLPAAPTAAVETWSMRGPGQQSFGMELTRGAPVPSLSIPGQMSAASQGQGAGFVLRVDAAPEVPGSDPLAGRQGQGDAAMTLRLNPAIPNTATSSRSAAGMGPATVLWNTDTILHKADDAGGYCNVNTRGPSSRPCF